MQTWLVPAALALLLAPSAALGNGSPSGDPSSGDSCLERAVAAVEVRYAAVRDLRASFAQTTKSVTIGMRGIASPVERTGTVAFAKPGKMRWSYEHPEPSEVISDGRTLWIYDPAAREVQKLSVGDGVLSGAAIQFLLGEGDMRRDFHVSLIACARDAVDLELVPRRDATYEKLRVRIDPATGDLLRSTIIDLFGNVTEVTFSEIRANLGLEPGAFAFEPPDGVRVIEVERAP
jgi:outer membrane lipoprotein carrier protein